MEFGIVLLFIIPFFYFITKLANKRTEKKDLKIKLKDELILRKITEEEKESFIINYHDGSFVNRKRNEEIAENLYAADGEIISVSKIDHSYNDGASASGIFIKIQLKDGTVVSEGYALSGFKVYQGTPVSVAFEKVGVGYRYRRPIPCSFVKIR